MRRNSRRTTLCSSPPGIPEARFLTNGKLLARAFNPNRDTGPTILFRHRARAQSTIHFHPNEPDPFPLASSERNRRTDIENKDIRRVFSGRTFRDQRITRTHGCIETEAEHREIERSWKRDFLPKKIRISICILAGRSRGFSAWVKRLHTP